MLERTFEREDLPDALVGLLHPRMGLEPPPEPTELREQTWALARQSPDRAHELLAEGEWLADVLWEAWEGELASVGATRADLVARLATARRELWLWLAGERTWPEAAELVGGGVLRRVGASSAPVSRVSPDA
jgi:hypothetical protein